MKRREEEARKGKKERRRNGLRYLSELIVYNDAIIAWKENTVAKEEFIN